MQKTEMSFFRDKRILITGHTGFKGSWLSRILIDAGAKVTGVSLEPPTSPSIFSICRLENQMDSVIGDVRDFELLKEVFERVQPQIVIHLAAQPIVRESYKNPRETYETNVMGTVNILEYARQFSCVDYQIQLNQLLMLQLIKYMRTKSGSGATVRRMCWTDLIHIQTANPVRSWLHTATSALFLRTVIRQSLLQEQAML